MEYPVALLIFGILLLLIGLVGKVKAKELEVGTSSRTIRSVVGTVGVVLIALSLVETGMLDKFSHLLSDHTSDSAEFENADGHEQEAAAEQERIAEEQRKQETAAELERLAEELLEKEAELEQIAEEQRRIAAEAEEQRRIVAEAERQRRIAAEAERQRRIAAEAARQRRIAAEAARRSMEQNTDLRTHLSSVQSGRNGLRSPAATRSDKRKKYRPNILICSWMNGESLLASASLTWYPSFRSCSRIASIYNVFQSTMTLTTSPSAPS